MQPASTLARRRYMSQCRRIGMPRQYDASRHSRRICMLWLPGCNDARSRPWRWNPQVCTGFRCSRFWRIATKNVPGRRTDVSDCQWLQFLHSVGLLRPSYRPEQEVCAIRSLLRHRESLVQMAATHVQHVQKALDQMNLQLHHVISDITGVTGLTIIDAILTGKRDPHELAELRSERIKATEEA